MGSLACRWELQMCPGRAPSKSSAPSAKTSTTPAPNIRQVTVCDPRFRCYIRDLHVCNRQPANVSIFQTIHFAKAICLVSGNIVAAAIMGKFYQDQVE